DPAASVIWPLSIAVAAIILFIAFLLSQRTKAHPLLPLTIFKTPNLSAGNLVIGMLAAAWIPLWFFLNLYLQQTLQYSAFNSGLALLPMTITIMVLMVGFTGKFVQRFGYKANLVAGLMFLTASLIVFGFVPVEGSFLLNVLPASVMGAIGMSLAYIPGTMAAMSGAKPQETGLASGIVNTSYQIGSALGLAVVVVIAGTLTRSMMNYGSDQGVALTAGFRIAFISAAIVSGAGALLAIFRIKQFR
ncbi:MAG TPA: MFS transporter, partial [Chitinophagaceae bacterium]